MVWEINRWIVQVSVVMRTMYRSSMVKTELSQRVKLSIYWPISIPTLTNARRVSGFSLRDTQGGAQSRATAPLH